MSTDRDDHGPAFDGGTPLAGEWGLIRAQGADACSFLQGQLTQDVARLGEHDAALAGYCSPKGRLLASFVVWRIAADELLLACSADLLPATLKRLSMYVLRAKCRLTDASGELSLHGLTGPSARAWLDVAAPLKVWERQPHAAGQVIRLPDAGDGHARLLWAGPAGTAPALPAMPLSAWSWLEVESGVARVVAATVEQFVPQMVNLELVGGVDFRKGCYPGQEVVARSQYRGTLKRRMHLFDSAVALAPGMEVFHSDDPGQPAGQVVLAASLPPTRHGALVSLKTAALAGGGLLAGPERAPLRARALPYPVPAEAAD